MTTKIMPAKVMQNDGTKTKTIRLKAANFKNICKSRQRDPQGDLKGTKRSPRGDTPKSSKRRPMSPNGQQKVTKRSPKGYKKNKRSANCLPLEGVGHNDLRRIFHVCFNGSAVFWMTCSLFFQRKFLPVC